MSTKTLICVVGPTAIGKTSLGIALAEHFKTEIISADSRQFYKEMRIGTAVPTPTELKTVPHHFIRHKSIEEPYSVGDFERDALKQLKKLFLNNNTLVMVGGSGLYVKAVTHGLDYFPEINPEIRKKLNVQWKEHGLSPLQKQLEKLDPVSYREIALDNPHRVIRALEICLGTGKPFSSFQNKHTSPRPFHTIFIGLTASREIIYERINKRVEAMMDEGLRKEAETLYPKRNLNALNTVGYKELFQYFEDEITLEEAVAEIKKNTRRFAKRQLTWNKKNEAINWFDFKTAPSEIITFIEKKL